MKKTVSLLLLALAFLLVFCWRGYHKTSQADPQEAYSLEKYENKLDKQFSLVKVPDHLDFAGEEVPIHNSTVRERFSSEIASNSYWLMPSLLSDPEKAHKYSRAVDILKEKHIPADFIYLLIAESGLNNSVSSKGAAGVWQLMPESARSLGLQVDENVDERYEYIKATYAACEFIRQAYNQLGDWTLTAASYNRGIGGISRQLGDDSTKTFYDLFLNHETSRYIYKVLAIKTAMKNPGKYDYYRLKNGANPLAMKTFKIDTTIENLQQFAENLGYDIFILKKYNPWLVSNSLPREEDKTYTIEFPLVANELAQENPASPAVSSDTSDMNNIQKAVLHRE